MKAIEELKERELDAAVAEEVMGDTPVLEWRVEMPDGSLRYSPDYPREGEYAAKDYAARIGGKAVQLKCWKPYSECIDDAWLVMLHLRDRHRNDGIFYAFVAEMCHRADQHRLMVLWWLFNVADVPYEICRAALLAVRAAKVKQEKQG